MDSELIKTILAVKNKAADAPIPIDQYRIGFRKEDGTVEIVDLAAKPRQTIVFDLESLVSHYDSREIYYSRFGVLAFPAQDRTQSVLMALTPSKPLELIRQWERQPATLSQAEFVQHLKTTFRGHIDGCILNIIKSIKWNLGSQGSSSIAPGKVSLDKSIVAELTGTGEKTLDEIEYIRFTIPMFSEFEHNKRTIECHVRPSPESQTFTITPIDGQVEWALRSFESMLGETLGKLVIPSNDEPRPEKTVYRGVAKIDNVHARQLI